MLRPRRVRAAAAGLATAGAIAVLAIGNPERGGFPRCPFQQATGLFCPGCGSQRAIHALTHFDFPRALSFNALAVLALPVLAIAFVRWARGRDAFVVRPWMPRALLLLVVGFTIARNLPFGRALAP
jgi:hypothetical protein